ncbi:LexA family protein [Streptomyces chartreusis]|uniref:LexA family protein n=1 Tax=Streptomyces chartreusis TaxID=1969 RepID=UPI003D93F425
MTTHHALAVAGSPAAEGTPTSQASEAPPLTKRQWMILDFIRASTRHRGYPPTLREIGTAAGLSSVSAVSYQIGRLVEMKMISRDPGRLRAYRVIAGDRATQPLPVVSLTGCPLLEGGQSEDDTERTFVLKVILDPDLKSALLAGAELTVERMPLTADDGAAFPNALYGHVTAITHRLGTPNP